MVVHVFAHGAESKSQLVGKAIARAVPVNRLSGRRVLEGALSLEGEVTCVARIGPGGLVDNGAGLGAHGAIARGGNSKRY